MTDFWKVHAFSLATTLGVAYILCAIFDALLLIGLCLTDDMTTRPNWIRQTSRPVQHAGLG